MGDMADLGQTQQVLPSHRGLECLMRRGRPVTGTEGLGTYMYLACLGVGSLRSVVCRRG